MQQRKHTHLKEVTLPAHPTQTQPDQLDDAKGICIPQCQ